MRKTKDYGYFKVIVPKGLLDSLRREAKHKDTRLSKVAAAYFNKMIDDGIVFDMMESETEAVSLKDADQQAIRNLANKSNISVSEYVAKYYEKQCVFEDTPTSSASPSSTAEHRSTESPCHTSPHTTQGSTASSLSSSSLPSLPCPSR